jgi:hypothetical protein
MEKYTDHPSAYAVPTPNLKKLHERVPNQGFTMQTLQNKYEWRTFEMCVCVEVLGTKEDGSTVDDRRKHNKNMIHEKGSLMPTARWVVDTWIRAWFKSMCWRPNDSGQYIRDLKSNRGLVDLGFVMAYNRLQPFLAYERATPVHVTQYWFGLDLSRLSWATSGPITMLVRPESFLTCPWLWSTGPPAHYAEAHLNNHKSVRRGSGHPYGGISSDTL